MLDFRKFKLGDRVLHLRSSLYLLLVGFAMVSTGAESRPNFSGIWKLPNSDPPQIMVVDQIETELRVFQFIEDHLAMVKGPIDGLPHSQIVDGSPCDFLARWEGDSLLFETKRDTRIQYLMHLAADGKTILVERTPALQPIPEKWERQDPLRPETFLTGFDGRLKLDDRNAGLGGVERNRFRGWMGYAFNDVAQAEEYLAVIKNKPSSQILDEARVNLTYAYARNGLVRKALQSSPKGDRAFYKRLAKYPEMSVAHREYARVQAVRDDEGRIMLPATAAGKDASYMVDTGSNVSSLRQSEAHRLGLKTESLSRSLTDGMVQFDAVLTIVPVLTVGATRLENVPFWVVPDARLNWAGILGIDALLKLETLRWSASGDAEIGFPAQEKNIRKANLCFWDNILLADVSSGGQGRMVFVLDTGSNETELYARFATGHLDLVAASGRQSVGKLDAHGAHGEFVELVMPEITLSIDGYDATLRPAHISLERSGTYNERHGEIGMNLLNLAQRVTLDFQAMCLTLE